MENINKDYVATTTLSKRNITNLKRSYNPSQYPCSLCRTNPISNTYLIIKNINKIDLLADSIEALTIQTRMT